MSCRIDATSAHEGPNTRVGSRVHDPDTRPGRASTGRWNGREEPNDHRQDDAPQIRATRSYRRNIAYSPVG
jgi:hypothetical protein